MFGNAILPPNPTRSSSGAWNSGSSQFNSPFTIDGGGLPDPPARRWNGTPPPRTGGRGAESDAAGPLTSLSFRPLSARFPPADRACPLRVTPLTRLVQPRKPPANRPKTATIHQIQGVYHAAAPAKPFRRRHSTTPDHKAHNVKRTI